MKPWLLAFLAFAFAVPALAGDIEDLKKAIGRAGSIYRDESHGNRPAPWKGAGLIAKVDGEYVFISASHLTQGNFEGGNLKLTDSEDRAIKHNADARFANNDYDLEIIGIEIPKGIGEVPEYRNGDLIFPTRAPVWDRSIVRLSGESQYVTLRAPGLQGTPKEFDTSETVWSPEVNALEALRTYGNPLRDEHAAEKDRLRDDLARRVRGLTSGFGDSEFITESSIVAGMSGAAVFQPTAEGLKVVGFCKERSNFYKRSTFSTEAQLRELIEGYRAKKRGLATATRWRFFGKTVQDFGDMLDLAPELTPSGGGSDGTGVGGGSDGTGVGNGAASAQHSRIGAQVEGEYVQAFVPCTGSKCGPAIYANRSGRLLLKSKAATVKHVPRDLSLIDLFQQKAKAAPPPPKAAPIYGCFIDEAAAKDGRIRIHLTPLSGGLRYDRKGWITLQISREGVIDGSGSTVFEPVSTLWDPTTEDPFRVDIRGLFFTNADDSIYGLSSPERPYLVLSAPKKFHEIAIECHQAGDKKPLLENGRVIRAFKNPDGSVCSECYRRERPIAPEILRLLKVHEPR